MKEIEIEKITLNMGVGEAGNKLAKAMKLLDIISKSKSVPTSTKKRIPTWGMRPGLEVGCKVTIRGKRTEIIKNLLIAKGNKLKESSFTNGTISFGIPEYIDIPGILYNVEIGIMGLDVIVTLRRPGFNVKIKSRGKSKIGKKHQITKEDAMNFMKEKFNITIEDQK